MSPRQQQPAPGVANEPRSRPTARGRCRAGGHGRKWFGIRREGAAAVECALCIPVVVILMIGTLSVCSDIYLKETLTVAAFEGVRSAVRRRATPEIAIASAENILNSRGIVNGTVTVIPDDFSGLQAMDDVTVLVTAPVEGNSFFSWNAILPTRYVSARVTMVREFDD